MLEVAATVFLKLSDGFSKTVPTVLMAVCYLLSFFPMAMALRRIDVAVAYAVWSAVGTAALAIIGMWFFRETFSALKVVSIVLIVVGVVSLNLSSRRDMKQSSTQTQSAKLINAEDAEER